MIEKYIKELLFEQDCVILPGFGAFLGHYVAADIHPLTHKFLPPSKRLAFNSQLKNNDGLLIEAVSLGEKMSREEVRSLVEQFVSRLNHTLETRRFAELKDLGKFFYNQEGKLEFEPDNTINFLEDSYSLPELIFKPIERNSNTIAMNKPVRPNRPAAKTGSEGEDNAPKKVSPAVIIFPIILLLVGGLTAFFYFNQENESLASINPFVIFGKKEEVKMPEPVKEEVKEEPAPEPEISSHTSRYFVVVGSFTNKENALKMKNKLERKNVSATIVEPTSDGYYYRVAVDDFESKEDAVAKLKDYKKLYGKSVWVLSY